jgi:hypothetical protein
MAETEKQIKPLYKFAFIYDIKDALNKLRAMALLEDWDYNPSTPNKILYNYIHHTFKKLYEKEGLRYTTDNEYVCFNTGLVTPHYEMIFALFNKNRFENRSPYFFIDWFKESDTSLTKFDSLPDTANYFEDPSSLLYDPNLPLRVDYNHIIADNLERFPSAIKEKTPLEIRSILSGTIELTSKKVKMNYKTAIPQYFEGKIQLLLPLSFTNPQTADLALVANKSGNFYTARTCLTLEMAYNNARLIAKPDQDWLKK